MSSPGLKPMYESVSAPRATSLPGARGETGLFHLQAIYPDDETGSGYAFSGSSLRSKTVRGVIERALGVVDGTSTRVRMRRPTRAGRATPGGGLIELRFTLSSTLQRVVAGSLGAVGSKRALFYMDYFSNGFDPSPLLARLRDAPPRPVILQDGLSSFAMLGWRGGRVGDAARIYLSYDYEPDFVRSRPFLAMTRRRIDEALKQTDLLVTASEMDERRYLAHRVLGEERMVRYPNVFFPEGLLPPTRETPHDAIVVVTIQSGWSGRAGAVRDARELLDALRRVPGEARLRVVAVGPQLPGLLRKGLPPGVELSVLERMPNRLDFLKALSAAHVGLNLGRWVGGTNVKKYDYAISGLVVLSNRTGSRGEKMPHELVFDDGGLSQRLAELAELGLDTLHRMGLENREWAERVSRRSSEILEGRLKALFEPRSPG